MCICVWLFGVRDALRDICRNMMEYGMISRRIWYLNLHDWKLHRRFTGFNSTVFWVSHRWRWDVVKNWRSKHTATLAPMNATCTVSSFKSCFTPILTSHAQSKVFCQPAWTCLPGVLPFFTPNLKIEIDWKGAVRCLLMCPNMSKPYIWDHNCQRRLALARKEIGWFPTRKHKNSMKWQGRQPCHLFQDSWRDHTWPQSHANFWGLFWGLTIKDSLILRYFSNKFWDFPPETLVCPRLHRGKPRQDWRASGRYVTTAPCVKAPFPAMWHRKPRGLKWLKPSKVGRCWKYITGFTMFTT